MTLSFKIWAYVHIETYKKKQANKQKQKATGLIAHMLFLCERMLTVVFPSKACVAPFS